LITTAPLAVKAAPAARHFAVFEPEIAVFGAAALLRNGGPQLAAVRPYGR
jgi:hypothetical protein